MYVGDVLNLCGTSRTDLSARCRSGWKSLVLLVPVRLGSDMLNPAYTRCVKVCYDTHRHEVMLLWWSELMFSLSVSTEVAGAAVLHGNHRRETQTLAVFRGIPGWVTWSVCVFVMCNESHSVCVCGFLCASCRWSADLFGSSLLSGCCRRPTRQLPFRGEPIF